MLKRKMNTQPKSKQTPAPVLPKLDPNVDYVSPAISMGGPVVTNTFLANRIACDRFEVNGFEPLDADLAHHHSPGATGPSRDSSTISASEFGEVNSVTGQFGGQFGREGNSVTCNETPKLTASQQTCCTSLVHNGVMRMTNRAVRQSVSLPANVAAQVRGLAKARRLSANRMLVELIENGMEAEKRKQQEFFDLAERFRSATDPDEVKRLGDQMGRMVFGN